jgi:hypothetical protein
MNKRNFDKLMEEQIVALKGRKAKLLLHACCAPCSSACLERLHEVFDITVLFYNPNIEEEEYLKRKAELVRLITETGWAKICDCDHDESQFYDNIKGLEDQPEGGKRCLKCFFIRLEKTAQIAKEQGYDFFTTTLTISPLKNAEAINSIGESLGEKYSVQWLYSDFKKKNGYLNSIKLSQQHHLYRQNYCGCIYSRNTLEK